MYKYHSFDLTSNYIDIYNNTNCSSNSSDNSNGYSVGHHPSYEFAKNNFNNLTNNNSTKPYFDSSSSTSRTFRKNIRPMVGNPNPVNSHVTINNTNVTHHIIHPIRQLQYDPDNRTTNVIPNTNTNLLNSSNQNAPGHVRFTSTTTSSVTSSSSSSNITHPKSILRRKNLNSSSNVMTSSNNNNNHNNGWNIQGYKI